MRMRDKQDLIQGQVKAPFSLIIGLTYGKLFLLELGHFPLIKVGDLAQVVWFGERCICKLEWCYFQICV